MINDQTHAHALPIYDHPPQAGFFDFLHHNEPPPVEPTIWDKWGKKLEWIGTKLSGVIGPIASDMICTVLKVLPIALVMLIIPNSVIFGMFAITAVATIIKPELFYDRRSVNSALGHTMGCYSALQAIWSACSISFSATPQLCLVAALVHLVICSASFKFDKYIAAAKRKKEEEEAIREINAKRLAALGHKPIPSHEKQGLFAEPLPEAGEIQDKSPKNDHEGLGAGAPVDQEESQSAEVHKETEKPTEEESAAKTTTDHIESHEFPSMSIHLPTEKQNQEIAILSSPKQHERQPLSTPPQQPNSPLQHADAPPIIHNEEESADNKSSTEKTTPPEEKVATTEPTDTPLSFNNNIM